MKVTLVMIALALAGCKDGSGGETEITEIASPTHSEVEVLEEVVEEVEIIESEPLESVVVEEVEVKPVYLPVFVDSAIWSHTESIVSGMPLDMYGATIHSNVEHEIAIEEWDINLTVNTRYNFRLDLYTTTGECISATYYRNQMWWSSPKDECYKNGKEYAPDDEFFLSQFTGMKLAKGRNFVGNILRQEQFTIDWRIK